ncbi:MAG TPA: hypothetical protein PLT82_01585 [Candidatus Hydrogenedens sp.]|nr:hypothetical protein [Candidatus Hydrogenedens sp.]HOK08529.1 hypothetical protein [Candidatus Hydrogenedens sp.]HOL19017.1 hypothetical protein [Candidatus Hydrogenedens sp.]HPP57801.1 hypothetical protein [Candidatus Hydrogenedens sp.]
MDDFLIKSSSDINQPTQENLRSQKLFFCFILLCITFITYINTFDNDWVWDDVSSVLIHKHVQNPKYFFQLFLEDQHAFGRGQGNFYRPLVSVSFMVDYLLSTKIEDKMEPSQIPKISPLIFHITNTLWHGITGILIFILLSKLSVPLFTCFWTSAIFCVHPIPTEAVTYISGRADMMSATFMLLGLITAIKYVETDVSLKKYFFLLICPISFWAGLLSKESSNIFPFLLLLILWYLSKKEISSEVVSHNKVLKWLPLLLTIIVAVIYISLRLTVLSFAEKSAYIPKTWGEKIIEVGQSFAFYIRVLFFPIHLHMEQTLENTPIWTMLLGYIFLIFIMFLCFWSLKNKSYRLLISALWFLITWFPISGFFTLNAPQAEHWMYTPMIGFWWCFFELIYYVVTSKKLPKINNYNYYLLPIINVVLLIITVAFFYLTYLRNEEWKDNETIFRSTLSYNPNTTRVRYNLAVTYEEILKNYPGAKREYQELTKIYERIKKFAGITDKQISFMNEDEIETWLSLGKTLFHTGKFSDAIDTLTPVSFLIKQKEFAPYGIEALWFIAQSSLALGDIKTYQIISSKIQNIDEKLSTSVRTILLGNEMNVPSYLAVENTPL